MLNPVREGERIEAIRYRRRLKIFEKLLFILRKRKHEFDVCHLP